MERTMNMKNKIAASHIGSSFFFLLIFLSSCSLFSQTLTKEQERTAKKVVSKQFGIAYENRVENLGLGTFCNASGEIYYNPDGFNYLFRVHADSLERLDHSVFHCSNSGRFLFSFKNIVYALGGYGFFTTNNNLIFFNNQSREWLYEPTSGEVPPNILGIAFKSGNNIYSFNNFKCGNNVEADIYDPFAYSLDLESMKWQRFDPITEIPRLFGSVYYTRDYVFFLGSPMSLIIYCSEKQYVLISNDKYNLSPGSYITSIDENYVFINSFDDNAIPLEVKFDLNEVWQQNLKNVKILNFGKSETKKADSIFFWPFIFIPLLLILASAIIYLKYRKKKQAPEFIEKNIILVEDKNDRTIDVQEEVQYIQSHLVTAIKNAKKSILTSDELDELLNISHLEPDSRKLRRFRLLKELSKSHPFMISRVKDNDDKRRFHYKVIV